MKKTDNLQIENKVLQIQLLPSMNTDLYKLM
jgi:hypothetical protein